MPKVPVAGCRVELGGPASARLHAVRWTVATTILAALLVAGPAGAKVGPFVGPPGGPRVAAVGDSLLGQLESEGPRYPRSTEALTRTMVDEGWRALVEHRNAWRTARVRVLAGQALDRGAEVLILVTGSGDIRWVRESPDPTTAREAVRRSIRGTIVDLADRCVVWPTVPVVGIPRDRVTAQAVNHELDAADAGSVYVRSPDWGAEAVRHPEWFIDDGVHLSRSGEAAFQYRLLTAARACVAGLG